MSLKKFTNLIRTQQEWNEILSHTQNLKGKVIQNLDFIHEDIDWQNLKIKGATFLGCEFKKGDAVHLISNGAIVYPKFSKLPYNPHRSSLYTWQELMDSKTDTIHDTSDLKIYNHFVRSKYNPPMDEAMAQRIHDYAIDVALRNIIAYDEIGMTEKKIVGFMGGHATQRGSEYYVKVAFSAKRLTEKGYFISTGGGPGIMEAANLGAYFGNYSDDELKDAIQILSDLQFDGDDLRDYFAINYFTQAKKVLEKYPEGTESLAIPTWFYGHEPSNLFASHIAKYFSNSIREDTLLAICLYGIVYAPGSAGTTQEIFQEAAQNHYGTFGYYSPMIFLGKKRYIEDTALYSVLHQLAIGMPYKDLLYLTDDSELVVDFIEKHPPIKV
ncbi:LOG family protein [Moheibacter sp.]|uniref:LOG family protein n=1 Tax=Moheibacter sp. TaxID=1965316 RepID=UPI003C708FD1